MNPQSKFIFVTCQAGAESAVKDELAREWPDFRFAYSRPGFLTFKLPDDTRLEPDFDLRSVFARAYGLSVGRAEGAAAPARAAHCARVASELGARRLHVWPRDGVAQELADSVGAAIRSETEPAASTQHSEQKDRIGLILDVIIIDGDEWWIGYHKPSPTHRPWPGGIHRAELPAAAPSRAYLKLEEGLEWSGLAVSAGQVALELGSSPGGASFALLQRGLRVVGVDPADMDPIVATHANFRHIRLQALQLKNELAAMGEVHWLFVDMNITPDEALEAIGRISKAMGATLTGGLFTLKLKDWKLARRIPEFADRLRACGFTDVRAAHLSHNRNEVCFSYRRKSS